MPAEVMFARKIKSVFEKLLLNQWKPGHTNKVTRKRFKTDEKVFFYMFQSNKSYWETSTVDKQIGNIIYIIWGPGSPVKDTWTKDGSGIRIPLRTTLKKKTQWISCLTRSRFWYHKQLQNRRSKRKREIMDLIEINPKRKNIDSLQSKAKKGVLWGYTPWCHCMDPPRHYK